MDSHGNRLKILTANEIEELYDLPHFTDEERNLYFSLSPLEHDVLKDLRTTQSKVHFILLLGYFKAKRMFFVLVSNRITDDICYVCQRYFPDVPQFPNIQVTSPTRFAQQTCILKLLGYRDCTKEIKESIYKKASHLATIFTKPIYVFKELISYLENQRIAIPPYGFLQDLVGKVLSEEKNRLETLIMQNTTKEIRAALDQLLSTEEGLYELTFLKKEPKDFSYKVITTEVRKRESIESLYKHARTFLPTLKISNESICYYASLASYYSTYRLKRIRRETAYIYLICFVFHRYHKINDDLIDAFIYYVNKYTNEAKKYAQEEVYKCKVEGNHHLKDAAKILDLFIDESISEETQFGQIKQMAFQILKKDKFSILSQYIAKAEFDETEYEWNYYVRFSSAFKKNLRYIFLSIDFKSPTQGGSIIKAVTFLKETFSKNKSLSQLKTTDFPQEIISSRLLRYLYDPDKKGLNGDKYEFQIYRLLKDRLESGDVFVEESLNFKSFEEELISNEKWKQKDQIIQSLELPYLHKPVDHILASFEENLENTLKAVNDRIQQGNNPYIKTRNKEGKITWSLPYQKIEDETNHSFYQQFPQVGIGNILHFVNQRCGYMDAFTHILEKNVRSQADYSSISASILAQGLNIGLVQMADISDMSYSELTAATNNFLRPETLKSANDLVINKMAGLPIFEYYNIKKDTIHSSSDGQKFETQFNTINSRYSPKYFGLKKGITSYTLVANHIPINAKIIGANEHESHYVFDILFNNTSEVEPQIHSTDTHGTNEVNFAILHLFGYSFAPRYRDLGNRPNMIYGFKNQSSYKDYILKPIRKINTQLIKDEWENIQRIVVSLAFKSTTQATIIRKLSSYHRKNKTKRALWEYDNIIKTLYVLDYIDSLEFRQNIQKALNRGEAYHQLRRAISFAHFGKFRVKTEMEQQMWNECSRLIANCIIFYNAYILSGLLEHTDRFKQCEDGNLIKKVSPVAWQHINLYGQYEFHTDQSLINIEEIIDELGKKILNQK